MISITYLRAQEAIKEALQSLCYIDRQLCRCPQDPEHVDVILELVDVVSSQISEDIIPLLESVFDMLDQDDATDSQESEDVEMA